jgi:hypothetical protein
MVVRGLRDTSYKTEHCTRYFFSLCRNNIKEDRLSEVPTYPARSHPWSSSRSIVIAGSTAAGLLQAPRPMATLRQLRILPPNLCSNSSPRCFLRAPCDWLPLTLVRLRSWSAALNSPKYHPRDPYAPGLGVRPDALLELGLRLIWLAMPDLLSKQC